MLDTIKKAINSKFFPHKINVGLQPVYGAREVDTEIIPAYLAYLQYETIRERFDHLDKPAVAVIDNGTDSSHNDLKGDVIDEKDFYGEGLGSPGDHSTHVTGIITGDKFGLSRNIPVTNYRALSHDGAGTMKSIQSAFRHAMKEGHEIINLSVGSQTGDAEFKKLLKQFTSKSKRHFVVIAAGNDSGETDYPAHYANEIPGVFSVAAARLNENNDYDLAPFSSRGVVTVSYVGKDIMSTATVQKERHRYMSMSGTSMACPAVSALISLAKAIYPEFELKDFHQCAKIACIDMGKKGEDNDTGYGMLHPINFLDAVEDLRDNKLPEYVHTEKREYNWFVKLLMSIFK